MLEIVRASNLSKFKEIDHGFFTKNNGFSTGKFSSLNISYKVGDDPENVKKNRLLIEKEIGSKIAFLNQDHTDNIFEINKSNVSEFDDSFRLTESKFVGDGIITNVPGLAIGSASADCVIVLIYAHDIKYIANIHSGWKGTFRMINEKAIQRIISLGAKPENISISIGPSISVENYPVDDNFRDMFLSQSEESENFFVKIKNRWHFNNKGYVLHKYSKFDIKDIHVEEVDTFCDSRFYSYRSELGDRSKCGRFFSFIKLSLC